MRALRGWPARIVAVGASLAVLFIGAPASAAVTPPFDLLPAGPAPTTVPYAIGMRVFYQGHVYTVPGTNSSVVRVQPYHGNTLVSVFNSGSVDYVGSIGIIGPTSAWRSLGSADLPADATLAGQLLKVVEPDEAQVFDTSTNRVVARLPVGKMYGDAKAVGALALVTGDGFSGSSEVLWDPAKGSTIALSLDSRKYKVAQRRSPGWLWRELGGGCFARVAVSAPLAAGTRICNDPAEYSPPLLSFDGTTAVVVRGGRLVAVVVDSGRVLSTGSMAAIVRTANDSRAVYPVQWETTSTYLAEAKWDGQLALVRCRISDGRCERVVRSFTRTGVSQIVAGW